MKRIMMVLGATLLSVAAFAQNTVSEAVTTVAADVVSEGLLVFVAVGGVIVLGLMIGFGIRLLRRSVKVG